MISALRRALRTQRRTRLVVLYGSMARGDGDQDSDLDLLVHLDDDRPLASVRLAIELERVSDRRVDVARLERVQTEAPLLLDRVLAEGRVLVDRDQRWPALLSQRRALRARARRDYERQMSATASAIEQSRSCVKHCPV
ncbi:MAG: nucleotidyltransferase domain-containing protein [Solirubrobacterales bacterium]